jgi:hypothetical protein
MKVCATGGLLLSLYLTFSIPGTAGGQALSWRPMEGSMAAHPQSEQDEFDSIRTDEKEYLSDAPRKWRCTLSLAGVYDFPGGIYFDDVESGIGFEARLAIRIAPQSAIRFVYVKRGIDVDASTYALGLQQYYSWGHAGNGLTNYFYVDAGVTTHNQTGTAIAIPMDGGGVMTISTSSAVNDKPFTVRTGLGLILPLDNSLEFDGGVGIDLLWTKEFRRDNSELYPSDIEDPANYSYAFNGYLLKLTMGINVAF